MGTGMGMGQGTEEQGKRLPSNGVGYKSLPRFRAKSFQGEKAHFSEKDKFP
jgi:hypothetical protein